MGKVYDDGTITLYQGDAWQVLQTLPDNTVDGIITDTPYSSGAVTIAGKQAPPSVKYQNTGTVKQYPEMLGDGKDQRGFLACAVMWLSEAWRVARNGAQVLVFTDWRQLPTVTDALQAAGFFWRGIVIWNKRCGRPVLGEFRRDCEFIVYGSKGRYKPFTRRCLPCIYSHAANPAKRLHISGKPLPLLIDLMEIVAPGGTVLDPFAGGGTTAQAAKETGRKCITIELSAEYAEIATNSFIKSA
ncbi:MAG: site-specific DNA-methyltransferase [Desulfovibrio sp.]|jgi:site-specific DNA-methyltransferase (adenine-specific)|nr:site-specific DNA-methyltransferase [Desulfovibrio sp.]